MRDLQAHPPDQSKAQSTMIQILKRFEANEGFSDEDGEDGVGGIDEDELTNLTDSEVLKLLSPEQFKEFELKLQAGQLGPEFLEATFQSQCRNPWWITADDVGLPQQRPSTISGHLLPKLPDTPNNDLTYHVFSVVLGYVFLVRRFGLFTLSEAREDRRELFHQIPGVCSILFQDTDRPACIAECFGLLFKQVPQAVKIENISSLVKDMRILFPKPKLLQVISEQASDVPYSVTALSDLHGFLDSGWNGDLPFKKKRKGALMKLRYLTTLALDSRWFGNLYDALEESQSDSQSASIWSCVQKVTINEHPSAESLSVCHDSPGGPPKIQEIQDDKK